MAEWRTYNGIAPGYVKLLKKRSFSPINTQKGLILTPSETLSGFGYRPSFIFASLFISSSVSLFAWYVRFFIAQDIRSFVSSYLPPLEAENSNQNRHFYPLCRTLRNSLRFAYPCRLRIRCSPRGWISDVRFFLCGNMVRLGTLCRIAPRGQTRFRISNGHFSEKTSPNFIRFRSTPIHLLHCDYDSRFTNGRSPSHKSHVLRSNLRRRGKLEHKNGDQNHLPHHFDGHLLLRFHRPPYLLNRRARDYEPHKSRARKKIVCTSRNFCGTQYRLSDPRARSHFIRDDVVP